jgi:muramoyltetrapeptide carboxypeptidase
MFIQLKRAGMLANIAGLIIGGFTEMKDTTVPFGKEIYAVINYHLKEYSYPVCFNFPVSHETENYALKIGIKHHLNVTNKKVQLNEL